MRHGKKINKLGREAAHRKALMRNLAKSMFKHGYITTTLAKAKALRPFAEKIITKAVKARKAETLQQRMAYFRQIEAEIHQTNVAEIFYRLINVWAIICLHRPGGYLRIIKLGRRDGDNAEMAYIGIVLDEGYIAGQSEEVGLRTLFKSLEAELIDDHMLSKRLLSLWRIVKPPTIKIESNVSRNRKTINFEILLSEFENPDKGNWPIANGDYLDFPLIMQLSAYSPKENHIDFLLQGDEGMKSFKSYNDENTFKVMIPAGHLEYRIKGRITIGSSDGDANSIKELAYCHIRLCGPAGDLLLYNFKSKN